MQNSPFDADETFYNNTGRINYKIFKMMAHSGI